LFFDKLPPVLSGCNRRIQKSDLAKIQNIPFENFGLSIPFTEHSLPPFLIRGNSEKTKKAFSKIHLDQWT